MAEKVTIELEAKTGKAEANIQDVVNSVDNLNKSFVEANESNKKSLMCYGFCPPGLSHCFYIYFCPSKISRRP